MARQKFNTPLIANGLPRNEPIPGAQQGQVATPALPYYLSTRLLSSNNIVEIARQPPCFCPEKWCILPENLHHFPPALAPPQQKLLQVQAIKLQPANPFTWASGWHSPIYCDNRKALSFPQLRSYVKLELVHAILAQHPQVEAIAGVATGAIAQGALVAEELHLPFVYVRSKPKDHGLANLIEGELPAGAKVVVVEDLISTGGSSLKAVEALRQQGAEVLGMVASFTYGFPVAQQAFSEAHVALTTLTDYEHVIEEARATGYIREEEVALLQQWRQDPAHWNV